MYSSGFHFQNWETLGIASIHVPPHIAAVEEIERTPYLLDFANIDILHGIPTGVKVRDP